MALKPTIYKVQVTLSDSDRNCFESFTPTLALHPSETVERMAVRLLAYCLEYTPGLEFTRGLSTADEPDLWRHADDGELLCWVEVGQPEEARLRKACGRAREVAVYAFGSGADTWWKQQGDAIAALPRLRAMQFDWAEVQAVAGLLQRTVALSISIVGGVLYVDDGAANVSLEPRRLLGS